MSNTEQNWNVDHDKTKCALCVVCARNCPTQALRREQEGNTLALYYNAGLCDGCSGEALCEKNCPESAIKSVRADSQVATGYQLLNQSEMVQCEYCEEYFAPVRRLEVISNKLTEGRKVNKAHCPLCRRTNLVISYIEEHRAPGNKAEYRSAKDIIRKANKRMEMEEKTNQRWGRSTNR